MRSYRAEQPPIIRGFREVAQVLIIPSFSSEKLIRVSYAEQKEVLLRTFEYQMWIAFMGYVDKPLPEVVVESCVVPDERYDAFWREIESLEPQTISSPNWLGVDGIEHEAFFQRGGLAHAFHVHSPDDGTPQDCFISAIWQLASEFLEGMTTSAPTDRI